VIKKSDPQGTGVREGGNVKTTVSQILERKGSEVWTIKANTLVYKALQLMQEKGIGALVVLGEQGNAAGIISERDYARKVILDGKSSKETETSEIMVRDLYVVFPSTTVDECISLMTEKRIRHLPVIDQGKLVGLVSMGDVVKAIVKEQRNEIESLSAHIKGK
jgi:CBS domain-containing protein